MRFSRNMQDIIISTPTVKSVVHCGEGTFARYAPTIDAERAFIITDSNVFALYGSLITSTFVGAPLIVIPAGEKSKNYKVLIDILRHMLSEGVTRSYTVVAFGGGVVGDIAGLASSLYMRGVNLVQIPTTLLAQVDSSVGGKTAVDLDGVKNAIGSFYQPSEVIVDPMFLKTLKKRELKCGLGEIVKYGALDEEIYELLLKNIARLYSEEFLTEITPLCIAHKARVVEEDERDLNGARRTLNLGHTTGHAFELFYKKKTHGEFVLIGMYYELQISLRSGICGGQYAKNLKKLIKKVLGKVPSYEDAARAAEIAEHDKKNETGETVSIVVPATVGKSEELKMPLEKYIEEIERVSNMLEEGKC